MDKTKTSDLMMKLKEQLDQFEREAVEISKTHIKLLERIEALVLNFHSLDIHLYAEHEIPMTCSMRSHTQVIDMARKRGW